MTYILISRLAPNDVANLRFSRNHAKYGSPPAKVSIGGVVLVEFESPADLAGIGVHCPPATLRLLTICVPGFKRIISRPCP